MKPSLLCATVQLKTVVTARVFLEKVKIQPPAKRFHRGIAKDAGFGDVSPRLGCEPPAGEGIAEFAWLRSPASLMTSHDYFQRLDGDPKGVILTHYNIVSNVDSSTRFSCCTPTIINGHLPFFHSFGFTGRLCLPAATGASAWSSIRIPLDSRVIAPVKSTRSQASRDATF